MLAAIARVAAGAEERHVSSPDDLCPPSADPCVISENVTIDPPGNLDFELRNIVVLQGARIRAERASILCGSFWVVGPNGRTGVLIPDTDAYASFSVTARRGCSLSPSKPCFDDTECALEELGTCSVGQGAITLEAGINGERRYGPDVELRAANDVVVRGSIIINGTGPVGALEAGSAGNLTLHSFGGDVLVAGAIKIKPAPAHAGEYDEIGSAGELTVLAGRDVDVSAPVDMSGAASSSSMNLTAGRDVRIRNNMSRDAGSGDWPADGGEAWMYAGRDLIVEPHGPADDVTYVTANAGQQVLQGMYENYLRAGYGGYTKIHARGALVVERKATFTADSPGGDCYAEDGSIGGEFDIDTYNGFSIDGPITARAGGCFGRGGYINMRTRGDGAVGPHGAIDVTSDQAGIAYLYAYGNLDVMGKLDTSGDTSSVSYDSYDYFYGSGGYMKLYGDDLTVSGEVLLGGVEHGSEFLASACRVRIAATGLIDQRCPPTGDCMTSSRNQFQVFQSIVAEPGSRILSEPLWPMLISYDARQPPVLSGTIVPPPILEPEAPSWDFWCHACGDGEIDNDETCDDWNITDDDGCSSTCVNEHCIAETPGYPATPLCADASACTNDRCDPLAGVCLHEPACTDDIACTQETCAENSCVVTPVDALCDDLDPCTTDLCNTLTGCVHAALVAVACDDNDVCTAASACEDDTGCVAPDPRPALGGRMTISAHATGRDDVLVAKFDVPAAEAPVPITESGVTVRLVDDAGSVLFDIYLPGALFSGHAPPAFDYRFDDPAGAVAEAEGVTLLRVRRKSPTRVAVQLRIKRPDLDAASSAGAFGLSVVFGADPDVDGCATLALSSCRVGKKIACRG
ncbi:MAG: hypothetical protein HY899_02400 [Deltaproteobacteria bacterium]|nr:hypothetical protein [Deltaproteobacteria bacterium]